jgi:ketosteroid isomerase-like protein/ribosomal protein L40E
MDHEKPTGPVRNSSASGSEGDLAHNPAVDDLFRRLKQDLRQPKPGNEAIAAALQAVQRLTSQVDTDASASAMAETAEFRICLSCGNQNPAENRFCAICGVPQQDAPPQAPETATASNPRPAAPAAGQHHYHHHYHHHYFASGEGGVPLAGSEQRATSSVPAARDVRARSQLGGASLSRAEAAVRKLAQDWAQACNSKQLDDLVSLYAVDAIVLRPNVPAVRGTAAIREFFFGLLDAGFGDVEMDPLRAEVFGDIAYEAGRCKMLVPFTVGKRREERGKYLLTLARQAGDWKILADCWSSDLSLGVGVDSGPAKSNVPSPGNPALKPPYKGV